MSGLLTCGFFQDTPRQPQYTFVVYKGAQHVRMLGESRPNLMILGAQPNQ